MELKLYFLFAMMLSPYDVISYDVISVKNFREILKYFFQIVATLLMTENN